MPGKEWEVIPHTGGMLVSNKTGKFMHQQQFLINREAQKFMAAKDPHTDPATLSCNGERPS